MVSKQQDTDKRIVEQLDVVAEYQAMGLDVTGVQATADGWIECRAFGQDDRNPSAGVNVQTGRYKHFGGKGEEGGENLSLWDFAAKYGGLGDWRSARRHFAEKAGVKLRGRKTGPAANLKFLPWVRQTALLWCRKKQPITPEVIERAGGKLARYRGQYLVIAMPVFGADLQQQVGQVIWNTSGEQLPIYTGKKTDPPRWEKMKSTAGSKSGLLGPVDLLADAEVVWKTEGPGDMLALLAMMPESLLGRHTVVSNAAGAGERLTKPILKLFAGKKVVVVPDADQPGQDGAIKQAGQIAQHAAEVRIVKLPYEIEEKHGKDLRDYLADGHDFSDLLDLVKKAEAADQTTEPELSSLLAEDNPFRLARLYVDQYEADGDGSNLVYHRDGWSRWNRICYQAVPNSDIRLRVAAAAQQELERLAEEGDSKVIKVTQRLVGDVLQATKATCHLDGVVDQPCWLDGNGPWPAREVLATLSGLLYMPGFVDGGDEPYLIEPTRNFFSPVGVDYPFDLNAPQPERWMQFLEDIWGTDDQSIEMIQEWFGYCLLPDTRQQKILMIVGPKRSGKGTVGRVLTRLVGEKNVIAPKLASLGTQFGSEPLIGKTVAIVADARLSGRVDAHAIVENLLSISGEDRQTIDRKNRESWSGSLSIRFTVFSNELPNFRDAAGAIASRIILLRTVNSFYGREDKGLDKALQAEMPGILLWSIEGYARLRSRGYFIEPESSRELLEDLNRLASPVANFVEMHCDLSPAHATQVNDLYEAWRAWCKEEGIEHPGSKSSFGRQLRAACPSLRKVRLRSNDRASCYEGIGIANDEWSQGLMSGDKKYYERKDY